MKLGNSMRWMAAVAVALMAAQVDIAAQDRDRDGDRRGREVFTMPNMFVQSASRARLGLYLDARQSRRYDDQGAWVRDVMHGSPAEDAGIRRGDIITAFDGQSLTAPLIEAALEDDFDLDDSLPAQRVLALAREVEAGQTVEITFLRDGDSRTVEVEAEDFDFPRVMTFGDRDGDWTVELDGGYLEIHPEMFERAKDLSGCLGRRGGFGYAFLGGDCPGSANTWRSDTRGCAAGVEFRELNPRLGEYFEADGGVLVIDVDEDSALGLMPGDVVLAVGEREVDTVDRVRRLIESYEEDEPIRMTIIRKGTEQVIEGSLVPY